MSQIKETGELIHELQSSASFERYAEENEAAFTARSCPHCGAPLQEGASYCTACMTLLRERRTITLEKFRKKNYLWILLPASALVLALLLFFGIKAFRSKKRSLTIPDQPEYQALLLGALDESTRGLWAPENLVFTGSKNGFQCYETDTALSDMPVCLSFSEDGKRLFFGLSDIPAYASSGAESIVKTAFSALYREEPENLEDILRSDVYFRAEEVRDERLNSFLQASGISLTEGASVRKSLPIRPKAYQNAPLATIWEVRLDNTLSYYVLFESENP